MADTTCGRCGRVAHMQAASHLYIIDLGTEFVAEAAYKCANCRRLSIATDHSVSGPATARDTAAANQREWHSPQWIPRYMESRDFPDVPSHIASAATEATLCLSTRAFRAAGALARSVVEATAKDKGFTTGRLVDKIDALHAGEHIRAHTKEQAHEIRHFGNDMAHGDFVDEITEAEAEEIVALMAEVLDEVFRSPARLARLKAARLDRGAGWCVPNGNTFPA